MDVKLHAFPSRDGAFLEFAQAALGALPDPATPAALQAALRARYPTAVVSVQEEMARHGEGPIVWYAFRTGTIGSPPEDDPNGDAWAILDDDRRFLEVSPGLARIVEVPARRMIGRQIEAFSNPGDTSIREDIARLWTEFLSAGTLSSNIRFNYADGRPRELAYRLHANAEGRGRHRLTVSVVAAPEA